ncbi:MAG: hypothetical protein JJT76_04025 [Clostridiaceae bacterium]|nr:hypothetical protein [Clostridiaceae bacterium]
MLSNSTKNQFKKSIVTEIQELKRTLKEVKQKSINEENSLLLQTIDARLSEKIKDCTLPKN